MRSAVLLVLIAVVLVFIASVQADPWAKKAAIESPKRMSELQRVPNNLADWPPQLGKEFPAIDLYDHENKPFAISQLRGKPILLEFIAMTCAGCQAFSGGNKHGGYEGLAVQANLQSIHDYVAQFANGTTLSNSSLYFVQIIIYNDTLDPPSADDLAKWRAHFALDTDKNTFVVAGGEALANSASFKMIPGFMLLDSQLKVVSDSTGHTPTHNLYSELLPRLASLLNNS